MNKIKVSALLLLLFITQLCPSKLYSQKIDIAILCDISKSIRSGELLQGKEAIQKLLQNGTVAEGWELSSSSSIHLYPFLAQKTTAIGGVANIVLLEFGTIRSDNFPYFAEPKTLQANNFQQANNFIENNFPARVQDQWTYESLAEAVISKLMKEKFHSNQWYIFVLSDFIESHGFSMTDEQTSLVDNYLEGNDPKFATPVILRWKRRPDLQIKIVQLSTNGGGPPPPEKITLLTPQNGFKYKDVKAINFIWNWRGNADDVDSYTLVVRKKERNKTKLIAQQRLKLNKYFLKKPSGGKYEWFVTANTNEGTFRSPIRRFQVMGPSALPWVLFILFLFVALIIIMKFLLPKFKGPKGKKEGKNEF